MNTMNSNPREVAVPAGVVAISLLVLALGLLGLAGYFFVPLNLKTVCGAAEVTLLMTTAVLGLRNHKSALIFVLLTAVVVTLDVPVSYFLGLRFESTAEKLLCLLRLAAYWAAYVWYKAWRTGIDGYSKFCAVDKLECDRREAEPIQRFYLRFPILPGFWEGSGFRPSFRPRLYCLRSLQTYPP